MAISALWVVLVHKHLNVDKCNTESQQCPDSFYIKIGLLILIKSV